MARRKDHTPEELKELILQSAERIIHSKGLKGLTARALAAAAGYAPGTIYNFYKDMDAVVIDINYATLGHLHVFCRERAQTAAPGLPRVKAVAHAYAEFARRHRRAWETIFLTNRKQGAKTALPKAYRQRLIEIFSFIERLLSQELNIPPDKAAQTARLLWACLHGITVLALDGRIELIGIEDPQGMIDDLLEKQLAPLFDKRGHHDHTG